MIKLGKGKLTEDNQGRIVFEGTPPSDAIGRSVVVLPEEDLNLLVRNNIQALLAQQIPMQECLYDNSKKHTPSFRDKFDGVLPKSFGEILYLDRKFYTPDPKEMVFIRYATIDQFLLEQTA